MRNYSEKTIPKKSPLLSIKNLKFLKQKNNQSRLIPKAWVFVNGNTGSEILKKIEFANDNLSNPARNNNKKTASL